MEPVKYGSNMINYWYVSWSGLEVGWQRRYQKSDDITVCQWYPLRFSATKGYRTQRLYKVCTETRALVILTPVGGVPVFQVLPCDSIVQFGGLPR